MPITTPAHGTAYDIAGQGRATVDAMRNAYVIACRMGRARQDRNANTKPTRTYAA